MNEGLKLTGPQIEILSEGVIHTYPYLDDLVKLLRVKMEVRFDEIAKGNTNEIKIFNLIQYFEADGRLKEFIRVIINDRPNSPYLEEVRTEFSSICENPTTPKTLNSPKEDRENILYIDLTETEGDSILLKCSGDNQHKSISTKRSPGKLKIKDFDNPSSTAKILYQWLNGSEKILEIDQETILALALPKTLVQYPWELLNLSNKNLIPVRWFRKDKTISTPKDRALGVLFMAAAPTEVNTKLNYEQQENKILEATKRHPINLVVEESGWLEELESILYSHQDYFDILHLSGQIIFQNDQACLLTENEFGNCCYSNSEDIAHALRDAFPKLIFLCGQIEYYREEKALSSLAIELIEKGVEVILTIGDELSQTIISALYRELARGETLLNAIQEIYRETRKEAKLPPSFLGIYLANTKLLSQALVTKGQEAQVDFEGEAIFRDPAGRMKVADRNNFVGRRRQLQNCLKALKVDKNKIGVLLHGMGGLGKSTIASRIICDRLPGYLPIIWENWGQKKENREPLNVNKLLEKLSEYVYKQDDEDLEQYLEGQNLQRDLIKLFKKLSERGKLLLLILDDFEWNLEPEGGSYKILPEPARVLEYLVKAIKNTRHKIIITCRYDKFDTEGTLTHFYSQGLDQLSGADLEKKLRKLKNFSSDKISPDVRQRFLDIALGNPRLLENLDEKVLYLSDEEAIKQKLTEYETNPDKYKDSVIHPELYKLIDESLTKVLSYGLVYHIPVPRTVLQIVCEDEDSGEIQRGINLSLIEESSQLEESDRLYRVSPILPHILTSIKLPEDGTVLLELYRKAYQQINQLWGNRDNFNAERWREIFRLAFADKENANRFREQCSKMIDVQYNYLANGAYIRELRHLKDELSLENIFDNLVILILEINDWKEADLEIGDFTNKGEEVDLEIAFIYYQLMVRLSYIRLNGFIDLSEVFPSEIIEEMIRSLMGHFGTLDVEYFFYVMTHSSFLLHNRAINSTDQRMYVSKMEVALRGFFEKCCDIYVSRVKT